ncbi:MAG: hypothetical protein ABIO71_00250 [Caldimonas sp.]
MRRSFLVAGPLLLATLGAEAGPVAIAWDRNQHHEQRLSIEAGGVVELCGRLPAGAKVRWEFEVDAPVNFNVHYHEAKAVHFPAREDNTRRASGQLVAAIGQDYCWMWTSKNAAPAALSVRLTREP